jgi:hypothetical protein
MARSTMEAGALDGGHRSRSTPGLMCGRAACVATPPFLSVAALLDDGAPAAAEPFNTTIPYPSAYGDKPAAAQLQQGAAAGRGDCWRP